MGSERAAKTREHGADVEGKRETLGDLAGPRAETLPVKWVGWTNVRVATGPDEIYAKTWPDLVDFFEQSTSIRVSKKDAAPGWSPTDATWRGDASVSFVYALALDCDNKGEWTQLLEALEAAGLAYAAHRTPGHGRDGACKWRLVLPLARPADQMHWGGLYEAARVLFGRVGGVTFDATTKDPGRFWFLPVSLANDPPRETMSRPGRALDLSHLPRATPDHHRSPEAKRAPRAVSNVERARAWLRKRAPAIQGSGGDHWTFSTAAKLVNDSGLSDAEALDLLLEWNARCVPPWTEGELVAKVANARKYGTHAPDEDRGGGTAGGFPLFALPKPKDPRPVIQQTADLHEVVNAAVKALALDGDLYQRGGRLVRVVPVAEPEFIRGALVPVGTPEIRVLSIATLRERLSAVGRFQKFDGRSNEWVDAVPNDKVTAAVADRGEWAPVRPLVAVVETPIVRPDLSIATEPGYDPVTGCIYWPSCDVPVLSEAPTHVDARGALALLSEPFEDFPYATEADRSVAVAAVLTLLARPGIRGAVPAFLFDASTRGSGKSLQSDCVATIATGRGAPRMGWPGDDIELEKVLAAYALRGAALVVLDNISTPFCGSPLDRVLTATDTVELRVLGRSEVPTLKWRATIIGTGNNLDVRGDTTRRVLVSRIEPQEERPEERSGFRHPDLLGWIARERGRLIAAGLTLLRAWSLAGRPQCGCKPWGSFEAWAGIIPPALVWAGAEDPMIRRMSESDPERETLGAFLEALATFAPDGVSSRDLVAKLYPNGSTLPGLNDNEPMRAALEALVVSPSGRLPTAALVGKILAKHRGRKVGGRRLEAFGAQRGVVRWRAA